MKYKTLFWISFSIHVLTAAFLIGRKIYHSNSTSTHSLAKLNKAERHDSLANSIFSHLAIDSNDIVMLGTSITQFFPATELIDTRIKNRGIGANTTRMMLGRIDEILSGRPKMIILETGINDLIVDHINENESFERIHSLVSRIKNGSPKTKLIIQSVLPVSGRGYVKYMPMIKALNTKLRSLCSDHQIPYLDIYESAGGDDGLKYTIDGLHPNGEGYKIMAESIKRTLATKY